MPHCNKQMLSFTEYDGVCPIDNSVIVSLGEAGVSIKSESLFEGAVNDEEIVPAPDISVEPAIPILESNRRFSVALSFAGEYREEYVEPIAKGLARVFGSEEKILYDKFHKEEFARRNLHRYLPKLYRKDSDLIVVFIGKHYNEKSWCGFEWRAIEDFLSECQENEDRVMFLKVDDGEVNGVYGSLDGYIDIREDDAESTVTSIMKRYLWVFSALAKSTSGKAKQYPSAVDYTKATGNVDFYPTILAISVLEKIQNRYPNEVELYAFAKNTLDDDAEEFVCTGKVLSESDLDCLVAKMLLDFSKSIMNSYDFSERIPHYLCEAINLFEKNEPPNVALLSECISLKAESYSRLSGRGNELMAELLAQDTG